MIDRRLAFLDRKFLAVACCLLAVVLILSVSGLAMLELVSAPSFEESPDLRSVRVSLRRLEEATANLSAVPGEAAVLDRLLIGGAPVAAAGVAGDQNPVTGTSEEALLPSFGGILQVRNPDGKVRYLAMLDGQSLGVRGEINGYVVRKITPQGVILGRDGRDWPLTAPQGALTMRPY